MNRLKFGLPILALGLALGYWAGQRSAETQVEAHPPENAVVTPAPTPSSRAELEKFASEDLERYAQLRAQFPDAERLRRAEEILGKIALLVLADLGIRATPAQQALIEKPANPPKRALPIRREPQPVFARPESPQGFPAKWAYAERRLESGLTPEQYGDFLRQVRIGDLYSELRSTRPIANFEGTMSEIQGHYDGTAELTRGRVWQVALNLHGSMEDGKPKGNVLIELSEKGKTFSRSSGTGEIIDFKRFSGATRAVLLQASPTVFMQLYAIGDGTNVIGNVYEKSANEGFELIGTVRLQR